MAGIPTWSQKELDTAKSFFGSNVTADDVYNKAVEYGMSGDQVAELYSRSTGKSAKESNALVSGYLQSTGKNLAGGYTPKGMLYTVEPNSSQPLGAATPAPQQPPAQKPSPYGWTNSQYSAVTEFAKSNPTNEQWYDAAQKYGVNAEQFADIYSRATGKDYNQILGMTNQWLTDNNRQLGGWYQPNTAADPNLTQYRPNEGMIFNPSNKVASARTEDWMVTPNQTVQGQLQGLLSQNNPLVQMAQTQGLENAQQRGLLNSSLGAEAGALAHYQYAMPIAQADAQTYANSARTNAENRTQMNQFNVQAENQYNIAYFNAQNELKRMEEAQKLNLSNLNTQQANQVRTNYVSQMNAIQQSMNSFINSVQASNDITPEAKSELIANYQNVQFPNMINMTNAVYSNLPEWQKEWTTFPPTIG